MDDIKATREKIDAIRRNENKEQRNKLKNDLPVYTFAGTFRERRNEGIENYSGIVVIDFDGIEALEGLKARVCRDSYTPVFLICSERQLTCHHLSIRFKELKKKTKVNLWTIVLNLVRYLLRMLYQCFSDHLLVLILR